ncbi:rCG42596, isoform CRA_a [Rattus norvegicus]|uniref:RCG42596, isoform CRA_a n=1 Tax=Rattus norvegicus TaxID=10116 RepID=A6K1M8_RAT|nr:rCG42596, isoform CRA_a [Rattus norvegicus]EDL89687.1 rCG42596, isoform CRA_a [Rattus norvegicus]EDL89688.1 rCG42596, isoform CRA_a [Rattus norvegicus]
MWPPLVLLFLLLPAAHGAPHPAADLQENFPSVLEEIQTEGDRGMWREDNLFAGSRCPPGS